MMQNKSENKVMEELNILFLGAGNRLSLVEQFYRAAKDRGIKLRVFAAELSQRVPIAAVAQIFIAPKFKKIEFKIWMLDFVRANNINIIIPNMDAATVALSELKNDLEAMNVYPVVSSESICKIMEDKILSAEWFKINKVATPSSDKYPIIIKHRFGFGGKNQFIAKDECEKKFFLKDKAESDYVIQNYIVGKEYTVDAYVDRFGGIVGLVPRQRLKIIDGEVNDSLTVRHAAIENITRKLLSLNVGWLGPITIQYIDGQLEGSKIIEINPRFGGGATHSIHCGLDMPGWIIDEYLGKIPRPIVDWKVNSLMTRCRRDIFHEHTA